MPRTLVRRPVPPMVIGVQKKVTATPVRKTKKRAGVSPDTYGYEKSSSGNGQNTWFGMRVWPDRKSMAAAGVTSGPYWSSSHKRGGKKVIRYVHPNGKERDVGNLVPTLRKTIPLSKSAEDVRQLINGSFLNVLERENVQREVKAEEKASMRFSSPGPPPTPEPSQIIGTKRRAPSENHRVLPGQNVTRASPERKKMRPSMFQASPAQIQVQVKAQLERRSPDDLEEVVPKISKTTLYVHRQTRRLFVKGPRNTVARLVKKHEFPFKNTTIKDKGQIEKQFPTMFVPVKSTPVYETMKHRLTGRLFWQLKDQPATRKLVVRSPLLKILGALGMRVSRRTLPSKDSRFEGFFVTRDDPYRVKYRLDVEGGGGVLLGEVVFSKFQEMSRPANTRRLSPAQRMEEAAYEILKTRKMRPGMVEEILEKRKFARSLYDVDIKHGPPAPRMTVALPELQRHVKSLFDVQGLYKPNWHATGIAGAFTEKSLNAQLVDWSSDTPPDGCNFKPWRLGSREAFPIMPHQAVVFATARLRAHDQIQTPGLLAYHSTGSGKTLETLIVMLQFWHKKAPDGTPWAIFSCSVRSNQTGNSLLDLAQLAQKHFPYFETSQGVRGFAGNVALAYETISERIIDGYVGILKESRRKDWFNKNSYLKSTLADRRKHYKEYFGALRQFNDASFRDLPDAKKTEINKKIYAGQSAENRLLSSYTTFINDVQMFRGITRVDMSITQPSVVGTVSNALWILDEVQFLVGSPSSTERGRMKEYRTVLKLLKNNRDKSTTWVFAATATPGADKTQFLDIMNVIRTGNTFKRVADLKKALGLISYVDMTGNRAQFASYDVLMECVDIWSNERYGRKYYEYALKLSHVPDATLRAMFTKMNQETWEKGTRNKPRLVVSRVVRNSNMNEESYIVPDKKITKKNIANAMLKYNVGPESNPSAFYRHLRKAAMYLSSPATLRDHSSIYNKHDKFDPMIYTAIRQRTSNGGGHAWGPRNAFLVGPKIALLLRRIKNNPKSLHYVYVRDGMSMLIIAYLLQRDLGMSLFGRGTSPSAQGTFGFVTENKLTQQKDKFLEFNVWTLAEVKRVISAASSKNNATGQVVRVLLGTKEAFKGVDVKNIRHLHLLDAMADFQHFFQFIGRGPRFCAHRHFSKMDSRHVKIHVYRIAHGLSSAKTAGSKPQKCPEDDVAVYADCHVWQKSWEHYTLQWKDVMEAVRTVAVDALIFQPTFHKAVDRLHKALHQYTCQPQVATLSNLARAKVKKNQGYDNNDDSSSNGNFSNMNVNSNDNNRNNLVNLSDLRRIPLEILNAPPGQRLPRGLNVLRSLVNDQESWVKEYVALQRKMAKNTLNNVNIKRLRELQIMVRASKKYSSLLKRRS
jgi:hypothetical protein